MDNDIKSVNTELNKVIAELDAINDKYPVNGFFVVVDIGLNKGFSRYDAVSVTPFIGTVEMLLLMMKLDIVDDIDTIKDKNNNKDD